MSLARQHFKKHQARAAAEQAAEFGAMQDMTAFELQMMQLNNDRQRLKQIQATDAKVVLKKALLPNHLPYIEGILEADKSIQDEVFMTVLVWYIDVGDYAKALQLSEFALRHNMIMPDSFKRNTATYVVETIAEVFLKQLKTDAIVDITVIQQVEKLILNPDLDAKVLDMPGQAKAKLYLALGKATVKLIQSKDEPSDADLVHAQSALVYLTTAFELDEKSGALSELKATKKFLDKFADRLPKPDLEENGESEKST
ncbi:phage terminase small subunit [Acinetobacter sichuanensis]|uniref:Terminase n=1 Tax=Acinetobacter sichuanensis TaxID=2136183 RepID=A0A371YQI6_9GAMM|nr:phage terminase small subunit [Acinetobacter sichuanensis]RFC83718.1 terminase [Acinetobacter sichuanensis]